MMRRPGLQIALREEFPRAPPSLDHIWIGWRVVPERLRQPGEARTPVRNSHSYFGELEEALLEFIERPAHLLGQSDLPRSKQSRDGGGVRASKEKEPEALSAWG